MYLQGVPLIIIERHGEVQNAVAGQTLVSNNILKYLALRPRMTPTPTECLHPWKSTTGHS